MKKSVELACNSRTVFTSKSESDDKQYQLQKKVNIKKEIFIDCLTFEALTIKRLIKSILNSLF